MGELPSLWLMITKDGFYPIQPSERCKPEDHGLLNDHVVRIEDVDGKVLWQRPDPAPNPLSQPYAGWGNDNGRMKRMDCRPITAPPTMPWCRSHRADPAARVLADRHYNRQKVGSPQFVPPGRCLVLLSACERAFWVTSYPYAEYVKHEWAGAWMCSAFRNEGAGLASDLIISAVAATRHFFGDPPSLGMVTFIDCRKVRPVKRRRKLVWGLTYHRAGFRHVGFTKAGLMAWQLLPEDMPAPAPANPAIGSLF